MQRGLLLRSHKLIDIDTVIFSLHAINHFETGNTL